MLDYLLVSDTAAYTLHGVGIAGLFAMLFSGVVPVVSQYKTVIRLVSVLLIVAVAWYSGARVKELDHRAQLEAAVARIKIAEEQAKAATAQIEYVYMDKVKTIKDVRVVVQERIKEVKVEADEQCKIMPQVIDIHNQSAQTPGVQ